MIFSIIIPSYNRYEFLIEAINSCLSQSFNDFEIIVVDDGSDTKIDEHIKQFFSHEKIKYFYQNNAGVSVARNLGAQMASGDYLVFLDSDDLLSKEALSVYFSIINNCAPNIILAKRESFVESFNISEIKSEEVIFKYFKNYLSKDLTNNAFGASNIIIKKNVFDLTKGFIKKNKKTWHAEDRDILLQLGTTSGFVIVIYPNTVFYRIHETNSINNQIFVLEGIIRIAEKNRNNLYPGNIRNLFNRYYIIGVPAFSQLKSLIRNKQYKLINYFILKTFDYLILFILLRIIKSFTNHLFPHKEIRIKSFKY